MNNEILTLKERDIDTYNALMLLWDTLNKAHDRVVYNILDRTWKHLISKSV